MLVFSQFYQWEFIFDDWSYPKRQYCYRRPQVVTVFHQKWDNSFYSKKSEVTIRIIIISSNYIYTKIYSSRVRQYYKKKFMPRYDGIIKYLVSMRSTVTNSITSARRCSRFLHFDLSFDDLIGKYQDLTGCGARRKFGGLVRPSVS